MNSFFKHTFNKLGDHIGAHAVVQAAPGKNDFWVVTYSLSLVSQIVGVNANAMSSHKVRPERQKVPFCAGSFKNGFGINTHSVENYCQLVNQGNIQVSLGVFNHLRCLCYSYRRCLVRPSSNNFTVKRVYNVGNFRR